MTHCPLHQTELPADYPLPPGRFGLPIIGETVEFARDPLQFVQARQGLYGDIFRTHILGSKTVFLLDETANRWIFSGEGDYLENQWNGSTRQLLGEHCVAMLTGAEHQKRRQQLTPRFKHGAMRAFAPKIETISRRYFEQWAACPDPIVIIEQMKPLVFELITAFILGKDAPRLNTPRISHLFRVWMAGITTLPIRLPFSTYQRALKAKAELLQEIRPVIQQRRQRGTAADDVLDTLLRSVDVHGQPLSDEAITHDLQDQIFAGYDTTVTVMTSLMLQLAQHPTILAAARAEIETVSTSPHLDLDELRRLPYLNRVLNESMRHIAPVTGTFRVMLRDAVYKGYRIPQGWTVRVEITGTHHHEQWWSTPEVFAPERWTESTSRPHSQAFIPFGGGSRICLGRSFALTEMRVMLALLLRDYAWTLVSGQDLTYQLIPFARPKSGLLVRFTHL